MIEAYFPVIILSSDDTLGGDGRPPLHPPIDEARKQGGANRPWKAEHYKTVRRGASRIRADGLKLPNRTRANRIWATQGSTEVEIRKRKQSLIIAAILLSQPSALHDVRDVIDFVTWEVFDLQTLGCPSSAAAKPMFCSQVVIAMSLWDLSDSFSYCMCTFMYF